MYTSRPPYLTTPRWQVPSDDGSGGALSTSKPSSLIAFLFLFCGRDFVRHGHIGAVQNPAAFLAQERTQPKMYGTNSKQLETCRHIFAVAQERQMHHGVKILPAAPAVERRQRVHARLH